MHQPLYMNAIKLLAGDLAYVSKDTCWTTNISQRVRRALIQKKADRTTTTKEGQSFTQKILLPRGPHVDIIGYCPSGPHKDLLIRLSSNTDITGYCPHVDGCLALSICTTPFAIFSCCQVQWLGWYKYLNLIQYSSN